MSVMLSLVGALVLLLVVLRKPGHTARWSGGYQPKLRVGETKGPPPIPPAGMRTGEWRPPIRVYWHESSAPNASTTKCESCGATVHHAQCGDVREDS